MNAEFTDDDQDVDEDGFDEAEFDDDEDGERELPAYASPYVDILDLVAQKAYEKASPELLDSPAKLRLLCIERGPEFLSELFSAVARRHVPVDRRGGMHHDELSDQFYGRWRHRSPQDYPTDAAELTIDSQTLRSGVAQYIKQPRFAGEFLDWYCADTLIYSELLGATEQAEGAMRGIFTTAFVRTGTRGGKVLGYSLRVLSFLLKWAIWLAALLFIGDALETVGVLGLLAVTVAWLALKWRTRSRVRRLLLAMRTAYEVFASQTFSWEIAWLELNRARELGAIWPGELYRLVEERRLSQGRK